MMKNIMVLLQKRGFLNNTRKISKPLLTTGGHIAPPQQKLKAVSKVFVLIPPLGG